MTPDQADKIDQIVNAIGELAEIIAQDKVDYAKHDSSDSWLGGSYHRQEEIKQNIRGTLAQLLDSMKPSCP